MHRNPAGRLPLGSVSRPCSSSPSLPGKSTGSEPPAEPRTESAPEGRPVVRVSGAEATVTGDSEITLKYPEPEDINDRVPDWVINPTIGAVTGAVGVAPKNHLSIREQLDEARLNGRLEIASMLELRVQRVGRSELEQDVRVERESRGDRSRKNTLGVDRNILDAVLAGSGSRRCGSTRSRAIATCGWSSTAPSSGAATIR